MTADKVRAEPTLIDLVQELRRTVGLFDGAMAITPQAAWEEALERVRLLKTGACWRCMETEERVVDWQAENAKLRQALTWVLTHDYGDSIVPSRAIADTMAAHAGPFATGGNVPAVLGVDKDGNPIKEYVIPLDFDGEPADG